MKDYEGAAAAYQKAKDQSSEALFNLGMMHVIGRGLPVDLHLAKRYFDQSKAGSPEAFLPAVIALQLLKFYSQWNPFIDRAVEWVSVLAHNVFGTDVHLPAETRTVNNHQSTTSAVSTFFSLLFFSPASLPHHSQQTAAGSSLNKNRRERGPCSNGKS